MCWNAEVSFMTGFFTYLISYYIFKRNIGYDRWFALVLFAVGTIQWIEGILWKNLDGDINYYLTTYAIPLVLVAEFLLSIYGATLYEKVNGKLIIFYVVIAIAMFIMMSHKGQSTYVDDGSLKWGSDASNFTEGLFFCLMLVLPFILHMKDDTYKYLIVITVVGLLVLARIYHPDTWGSNWCLFGNILSAAALLRPILYK
jgi:hypothetical protein